MAQQSLELTPEGAYADVEREGISLLSCKLKNFTVELAIGCCQYASEIAPLYGMEARQVKNVSISLSST
jgi:hypothetical protein